MSAIYVEITGTRGSTPRDAGTVMEVTAETSTGTIGGGALEYQAIQQARKMLANGADDYTENVPLGPNLGQCCGGSVTLHYSREKRSTDMRHFNVHAILTHAPHPSFLWLWGAGHVGRAVVLACPPQAFKITWVDSAPDRFPATIPHYVSAIPAADMPLLSTRAPKYAHHLIFTYSHEIDLALCAALLRRGADNIGLIGSATKRTRFFKRLRAMGLDPAPIICPIGDKSLGKTPAKIAQGCVTALLAAPRTRATA
ncbi:MAG: xanthine dehydrogenase accessory protein XdhC [Sulfitobacter sp.]